MNKAGLKQKIGFTMFIISCGIYIYLVVLNQVSIVDALILFFVICIARDVEEIKNNIKELSIGEK